MEINSKFSPGDHVVVNLGNDGSFAAVVEGVAFNKGRIFYCVKAGGICLYTIAESALHWPSQECPRCGGTGKEDCGYRPCEFCDGAGVINEFHLCPECWGTGRN